jgi:type IV pilus assembly protein PilA
MKKEQSGFTLIELMIVVAIIGILAAIALPAYQDYTKRAHVSEGMMLAASAKTAITEYFSTNGVFPTSNAMAGLEPTIGGNAVKSLVIAGPADNMTLTVTFDAKVTDDSTLVFKPSDAGGSIKWDCKTGTVLGKYRPSNCRA